VSKFQHIFPFYLWSCLGPSVTMAQYVKYFGFVDDVLLIHNGANGPKSRTMLFRQVRQMAAPLGRQITLCLVEFARWRHGCEVAVICAALQMTTTDDRRVRRQTTTDADRHQRAKQYWPIRRASNKRWK